MNKLNQILVIGLPILLTLPIFHKIANAQPVSIAEVVQRVTQNNLRVLSQAERVYQSRESVLFNRKALLPKLNLWRLAKLPFDLSSAIELVNEDLAPFLVPANWFRLNQSELLYLAEGEGFRALWANELFSAKNIYFHLTFDMMLRENVQTISNELQPLFELARTRELLGAVPAGTANDIEILILGLAEDLRSLDALILEEQYQLAQAIGLPGNSSAIPTQIAYPNPASYQPRRAEDFEARALLNAPEAVQFKHFGEVIDLIQQEQQFAFLGVSRFSRGTSGGVFDSFPIVDGLGFSSGNFVTIVQSQKKMLELQKTGVQETLRRTLWNLVSQFNFDLTNFPSTQRRVQLTSEKVKLMQDRMQMGEFVDTLEFVQATKDAIASRMALVQVNFRVLMYLEQFDRLTFSGDFQKVPTLIESLRQ